MKIEKIIYDTARWVLNLEDKLSIATLFLFCEKLGAEKLAELLYNDDLETFIDDLNDEYKYFDVDFTIRLEKREVHDAFFNTIDKYKEKNDSDGFLKAVYKRDPFALAICKISNYYFNELDFKNFKKDVIRKIN